MDDLTPGYDFGQDRFDLANDEDREIVRFVLSQALYGEATGVFCGKSLYAAGTLEAAKFYVRQAKQELAHLQLFADIFRLLGLQPTPAHWVIRLLAAHNNYYPLKVFMEHAIGEGMVLDIFKDLLLQTLPDEDSRIPLIKKKLRVVCKEEIEHVSWGEKETRRLLGERPWLKTPYYGLFELQMAVLPLVVRAFEKRAANHRVLRHLGRFLDYVRDRVRRQGQELGFVPHVRPGFLYRIWAMLFGIALFLRSQFARSRSTLDKTYLDELGFGARGGGSSAAALMGPGGGGVGAGEGEQHSAE
ncbi:ferritin-like domain-containing protein [Pendulispora albinea]|uniref:Ferritin-like domain-containing protein n=1 Tax=Pendulispora albinea TaxID=2741071 RepID=A0ABZ2M2A1_9BACT